MKTLVTANQKEGAGKAAKMVPLAFDFADHGLRKPAPATPTKVRALADYSDNKIESN